MGLVKGGFQRLFQTFLYALAFCCAGIILGIYSYFLAHESKNNEAIPKWEKAVEGMSGIAVLYTICAVLFTCCFGGIAFLAFLAIVIDVLMIGAFVAMAILTRHGASSCKGNVNTPIGTGSQYHLACRLNTAAFAVSIIGAFLFLCTALMQIALARHHKKEKRFGPSPANNYTSGAGKKEKTSRFGRKNKKSHTEKDAELGAAGVGAAAVAEHEHHHHNNERDLRPSHDTAYTGSTVAGNNSTGLVKDADPTYYNTQANSGHTAFTQANTGNPNPAINGVQYSAPAHAPHGSHGGYYTQPQGTGANPYGYENTAQTGTVRDF